LRAQETSELSSNDDDKNTRKTRRKICWSPSADESSFKKSKLPTPPNLIQDDDDFESKYDCRYKLLKKCNYLSYVLITF